ncbi:MAG: hypothetical protein WD187_04035 [Candidatus Woykebacteria bacterium]
MANYSRRFPRDPYEGLLTEALVACGYEVVLSSGLEDEIFGEDARDTEYDVPWDFYVGNGNNGRYAEKLAKAEANRVAVLQIPVGLLDDLCLPSRRARALTQLAGLYDEALSKARSQRLRSRQELEAEKSSWLTFERQPRRVLQPA